jgi:hypothetical protein
MCVLSVKHNGLINLVRECDILYNKRCSGYKNTTIKLKKWQNISESINSTGKTVFGAFSSFRSVFRHKITSTNANRIQK